MSREHGLAGRKLPTERIALLINSLPHKIEAVKAGYGLAHLFCFLAEREPGLVRLTEPEPLFDTDSWLLRPPNLRQIARSRGAGLHRTMRDRRPVAARRPHCTGNTDYFLALRQMTASNCQNPAETPFKKPSVESKAILSP
ncbi:MAG: hypothetical protein IPN66_13690 [Candidatus Competibacteraceae bacterium]|nr:hypothetical protein [Candidatus Competibacteraceae bacterium]